MLFVGDQSSKDHQMHQFFSTGKEFVVFLKFRYSRVFVAMKNDASFFCRMKVNKVFSDFQKLFQA